MEIVGGVNGRRGYYALHKWARGIILRPAEDPNGASLPEGVMGGILLDATVPKIPAECWTAMQRLFIHCVEQDPRKEVGAIDANNEVCVVFATRYTDGHVIVAAMPQVVGHARVAMDRTKGAVNLITGEKYPYWPPEGYGEKGDCHSHNTMGAFFSGTDDNDDKGLPGIHMVCGSYARKDGSWTYRIASSVVADKMRFQKVLEPTEDDKAPLTMRDMTYTDLADITWVEEIELHENVLAVVHVDYPKDWKHETTRPTLPVFVPTYDKKHGEGFTLNDDEMTPYERYWQYRHHEEWKPTAPPQKTKKEIEFWMVNGYWPDSKEPHPLGGVKDKDDPFDAMPSMKEILEWMNEPSPTDKPKDLPGQMTLFGADSDAMMDPDLTPDSWWKDLLRDDFGEIDDVFDRMRDVIPNEDTFRTVMAAFLNRRNLFKGTIKPRKMGTR